MIGETIELVGTTVMVAAFAKQNNQANRVRVLELANIIDPGIWW